MTNGLLYWEGRTLLGLGKAMPKDAEKICNGASSILILTRV